MSLDEYGDVSERSITGPAFSGRVIDRRTITFDHGDEGLLMEYEATVQGRSLHFLAYAMKVDDQVVLETLTAADAQFSAVRADAEPYLLTLEPAT